MKILDNTKFFLIMILFMFCSMQLTAQKESHQKNVSTPNTQTEEFKFPEIDNYDGTYQFILKKPISIHIQKNIISGIKNSRKSDEDYIMVLSKDCEVLILSEKKIKSKDFIPFKSPYIIR